MISRKFYTYKLYKLIIFILFLNSIYPWFIWNNNLEYIVTICSFLLTCYIFVNKNFFCDKTIQKNTKFIFIIIIFFFISCFGLNFFGIANACLQMVIWLGILSLRSNYKIDILNFITKYFSIILLFSLIVFILVIYGSVSFPHNDILYSNGYYNSSNYYFFITSTDDRFIDLYRFQSIFIEPGHLILGIVPLIIANKFNIKNIYVLLLFICALFTFSLAGYISLIVAFVLLYFRKFNLRLLLITAILSLVSLFAIQYFGIGRFFSVFFADRLTGNTSMEIINSRYSSYIENEYNNVLYSSDAIFGNPYFDLNKGETGSAGYKVLVVQHGLIMIFIVFFLYSYFYYKRRNYNSLVLSIIILLLLSQDSYPMMSCIYISYLLGNENIKNIQLENK